MELKRVNWDKGENPHIEVQPSGESNIFVSNFGSKATVGRLATVYGVSAVDATRISNGDTDLLLEYIKPDESEPGRYNLVNCYATLILGEHSSAGCTSDSIREYSPHVDSTVEV